MLSLLLQKALQLTSEGVADLDTAMPHLSAKQEESWPVALANSICHQVSFHKSVVPGSMLVPAGDETMTYRINHLILMRTCL